MPVLSAIRDRVNEEKRARARIKRQQSDKRQTEDGAQVDPASISVTPSDDDFESGEDWKVALLNVVRDMEPDAFERLIGQLADRGYDADRLQDIRRLVDAPHSDLFDVLSYIIYVRPAKTHQDRADDARSADAPAEGEEMKALLMAILSAYEENSEQELATSKLGDFLKARYGSVGEGKQRLGELPVIKAAFLKLQETLYRG